MVFSGLTFLFVYLPAVLIAYFAVPRKWKNPVLFFGSLVFYGWGEPVYIALMLFSALVDYGCGLLIDKYRGTRWQKAGLLISLAVNISVLLTFKYADFLITSANRLFGAELPLLNLPLPIGVSFYTFQTMSYTIDVYRGEVDSQKNFLHFGTYVTLFPQLIAGPIVRYRDVEDQLGQRSTTADGFADGVRRFILGLAEKVLLANNIGLLWKTVSSGEIGTLPVLSAWLGILAFAFRIYFDFSGYSHMAIGLGKMFGFTFPENFNHPYLAQSVTDFWRRWHISLGIWFRDYVYIPLGGNRRGIWLQLRNIAIVWLLTGLWHGAGWNFLLWGAYFAVWLIAEKLILLRLLKKLPAAARVICAQTVILFGWVLFAFDNSSSAAAYFGAMLGAGGVLADGTAYYYLLNYLPLLLLCAVASTPLVPSLAGKIRCKPFVSAAAEIAVLFGLFLICIAFLVGGSYNPFLYFRF